MAYADALDLQRAVAKERIGGRIAEDVLLLVEHPPVVTLGRTAKAAHLTAPAELLAARGVQRFEVERGGDVTFHGPGQLVGYPILDLKRHKRDLHWYLRQVEEALIRILAVFDVPAERSTGFTGVWTRGRKIASIGVHARDWVTWHGFALNVTTDLSYFDLIVPCGIRDVDMTSIARETGGDGVSLADVALEAERVFGQVFGLTTERTDLSSLAALAAPATTAASS
jgi:lipoyl(octanoyl) transferase